MDSRDSPKQEWMGQRQRPQGLSESQPQKEAGGEGERWEKMDTVRWHVDLSR